MANGTTIITFALRPHDFPQALGTPARLWWRQASSHVDVHALSPFHKPIIYRFIVVQGAYLEAQHQRRYCTPEIKGVATAQPMSPRGIRLACSLAVVCGGSLRHLARLFSVLVLMPLTQASSKRWMDAIGAHLPTPEELLQQVLALTPAPEWHLDGSSPLGTAHWVLVVKDEHGRLLMPHEAAAEPGEDAKKFLQHVKALGLHGTAAFSASSPSCTEAIKAVWPQARLQADHFHTVKHIWGHLKKARLSYRRQIKAQGEATNDEQVMARAQMFWQRRWRLLKKPATVAGEDKQALAELEREEAGFVPSFRPSIRQLVNIFDHTPSAAQARMSLQQLRQNSNALEDRNLEKSLTFFADHWEHACRYRRKRGRGQHRRGSNSESGLRLRRRREKNHDGSRAATTRQYDIQIYQAMQYLALDIAEFIEKGPQMTGMLRV